MREEFKPLEERIRDEARKKLKERIDFAAQALESLTHFGYSVSISELTNTAGKQPQVWETIGFVKQRIFDELVNKCEDDAIGDFLDKVKQLQEQLDELKALQS